MSQHPVEATNHHTHHHDHQCGHHHHAPKDFGTAFATGIFINVVFVAVEAFYGWQADSLALLADAAHNLSDVAGLLLAWVAIIAAKRQPTARYTYGLQRGSIIASFINAVVLLFAMGSLAWEAAMRLRHPQPYQADLVMYVAAAAVFVNGFTAWLLMSGSKHDLNIRGAFIHMLSDALVSVGVIISAAAYVWLGWGWIDPVVSLLIALAILFGTWGLFKQSLHLMFDGVPVHIDLDKLNTVLKHLNGVASVHDVHVWAMATSKVAMTAHLVLADGVRGDEVLRSALNDLRAQFGIEHVTLQFESASYAEHCHGCGAVSFQQH